MGCKSTQEAASRSQSKRQAWLVVEKMTLNQSPIKL